MAVLKDNETTAAAIIVHEVTYTSGAKRVSVLCDNLEEVRGMVEKFLGAGGAGGGAGAGGSGGAGTAVGASGNNDHEPSLKITRKAMKRDAFDALEDWDGGKVDTRKGGTQKP